MLLFLSCFIFSAVAVTEINGLYYPTDLLKKMDSSTEKATCIEVVDENSIKVVYEHYENPEIITFIGISEIDDKTSKEKIMTINKKFLLDKEVKLSHDWQGKNEKGEILAYVWAPIYTGLDFYNILWNVTLLINGYAHISNESFNTYKSILFYESYRQAREKKMGILKDIETEKPIPFGELPVEAQEYLYMRYTEGFKTNKETKTDSDTEESAQVRDINESFYNDLMVGVEWNITPAEVLEKTFLRNIAGNYYEGTVFDELWRIGFGYNSVRGSGENEGVSKLKLTSIGYSTSASYGGTEIYQLYGKLKQSFIENFGPPTSDNPADNITIWELNSKKTKIVLRAERADTISLLYTGETTF